MDKNEIPTQIGAVTIQFYTKTVREDLLAQAPSACFSSNTNVETGSFKDNGICEYCSASGNHARSPARKNAAYSIDKVVTIYHIGGHICSPRDNHKRTPDVAKSALSVSSTIKHSQMESVAIHSNLILRQDWKMVEKTAKKVTSVKTISNEKTKQKSKI